MLKKVRRIIVTLSLHLLGDYVMQKMLSSLLPDKRKSALGMLIHALYADGAAAAYIGHTVGGTVLCVLLSMFVGVAMHYAVDTWWLSRTAKKCVAQSVLDQAMHTVCLGMVALIDMLVF